MDKPLLISILLLVTAGFLIFLSASLGLLTRDSVQFGSIAFRQVFFGLIPGLILLYVASKIEYMFWRKWSFWIFLGAIILNIIIFIPGIGLNLNGSTRWLQIGSLTFQVSEALKIGAILYFAAWLSSIKDRVSSFKEGFLPLLGIIGIISILLLAQPDHDTLFVIAASLVVMYLSAGGKWKYIGLLAIAGVLGLFIVAQTSPYIKSRIMSYVSPSANSQTSGYQLQQSLIAIGSGGITGRGFGQSIQKFNYLPEPVGDSIFAVAAEEFGFTGSIALLGLFLFFVLRSFKLAPFATHPFGGYVMAGLATFMIIQAFINIGSMVGLLPIAGIPLPFVSQGGTALLFTLFEVGILLNISRYARIKRI